MIISYLSLGANQKHPERQLRRAIGILKKQNKIHVLAVSSFYRSKPWGVKNQPEFLNLAIKIATTLPPMALLKRCHNIEKQCARVRKKKWGPRTLDIDIVLYGNRTINSYKLKIPHPYMWDRDFVMQPLSELYPNELKRA